MAAVELQTPFGFAAPPAPGHSSDWPVTMHMPLWKNLLDFVQQKPELFMQLKNFYPRFMPNPKVQELANAINAKSGLQGKNCFLFASYQAAHECRNYALSSRLLENICQPDEVVVRCFKAKDYVYATFFPAEKTMVMIGFWAHAGMGIVSGRFAVANLPFVEQIEEVPVIPRKPDDHIVFHQLRQRIADLLERAVPESPRIPTSASDVYLFPTGMHVLFCLQQWLQKWRAGSVICWGFAFHSSIHLFEDFGNTPYRFFPTGLEYDELEAYAKAEKKAGRPIQALFTEFPSNPLVSSTSLERLREIATRYNFLLVVDDTLSSFCNVDVLGAFGADITWSSLTKSFNGYADAMAGSLVLNPSTPHYTSLKAHLDNVYHNDLYIDDALILESNSRDYLPRSTILNKNAYALASWFQTRAEDPASTVSKVFYPPFLATHSNYLARLRTATPDFMPGYGCLLSFEFDTDAAVMAFYDEIGKYIHIGPHLGAHLTLLMPYTQSLYSKESKDLEKVAKSGLSMRQIRVSAGLEENIDVVIAGFQKAMEKADATRST